ncbi:hypothetical protein HM1_0991 [Heliomicrobium modesticaldum Ice1]|uniref:Uncharacterized protein n=1 Tax=Heliobacterium modesticaldum (strain ATCC 51547 / Ice1) TaxID=498761 RepID=B0TA40_HELMI|nr:hypothetical protein [Heliomicrobium modesticaldum]ABZ83577.1 hypothetical protein HM1_0991 [Heliomicrobium modesticaldum Ice1]
MTQDMHGCAQNGHCHGQGHDHDHGQGHHDCHGHGAPCLAHGHDAHSHDGHGQIDSHGHDAPGHNAHDHDTHGHAAAAEKPKPSSWGWVPFALLLSGLLTFVLTPVVAYQGIPVSAQQQLQPVQAQTVAEQEVMTAVKDALTNRFKAFMTGDAKLLEKSFGKQGVADALQDEKMVFNEAVKQFKDAKRKGDVKVEVVPYKIDVDGNKAHVLFRYMVTIGNEQPIMSARIWDLAKTKDGWKVVGNSAFVDSPATGKVVKEAKAFLTALKFNHTEALRGPWDTGNDPLNAVTAKNIKALAGKGGSWEVTNVTLGDLMTMQSVAFSEDANWARVMVQNNETQQKYVLIMAKVPQGKGVLAAEKWAVYGLVSEKEYFAQ